jgi:hypothetical protein
MLRIVLLIALFGMIVLVGVASFLRNRAQRKWREVSGTPEEHVRWKEYEKPARLAAFLSGVFAGQFIRGARLDWGYTQREIAAHLGVHPSTVSKAFGGTPRLKT